MSERATWAASGLWLLTSFLCLILPIFLPSSLNPSDHLTDPISLSTGVMFLLSFPGGLLSLLFSPLIDYILGIDPNSLQAMYLNLKLMFVFGLAQWFWLVPRLADRHFRACRLARVSAAPSLLPDGERETAAQFSHGDGRTPVERLINDTQMEP